ncbi:MAG TPA: M20 family metallopeptidase [Anaerolineae bacterium]|nr:M20 family metallopeptidase [Anaerolineae bacterium]
MQKTQITQLAENLRHELSATRRDFHMHPELSGQEQRTAGIVADKLREYGLKVSTGVGGHGVIGLLEGKRDGPIVAWRADMDAVPGDEILNAPYKSCVPGVIHICGHDAHTTIGLGIAQVLAAMRDQVTGQVKFIFQPAEETVVGARAIIAAGGLENPRPSAIFALHIAPLPVGRLGSVAGMVLPGMTAFRIVIKNGTTPALINTCLQSIRALSTVGFPSSAAGLTDFLEAMEAGSDLLERFIVIYCSLNPEQRGENRQVIEGFARTANEELWRQVPGLMRAKLEDVLGKAAGAYELEWPERMSFPAALNHMGLEEELRPVLDSVVGRENVARLKNAFPFNSEDFAFYQQQIPGVMYWLGATNLQRGLISVPHMPGFDIDEECLVIGTKVMANVLLAYLDYHQ